MNRRTFAAIAIMPCLAVLALNLEAIHGHYAYSLPVARSTMQFYEMVYVPAEKDDYKYAIRFFPHNTSIVVYESMWPEDTPPYFTLKNVVAASDGMIEVDFAQNNLTITRSTDGQSYHPAPVFSHTETIGINQTFVVMCDNRPPGWSHADNDATGLVLLQYRGVEVLKVSSVVHMMLHGDSKHSETRKEVTPPIDLPTYKFLGMSGYTHGEMQCDYPQVIEHAVDSRRADPAHIKSVSAGLYDLYR